MATEVKSTSLCAEAAASQFASQAADQKNPTASEVAIHVFKKYVYNPLVIAAYPAYMTRALLIGAFEHCFTRSVDPEFTSIYTHFFENSNKKDFNLLSFAATVIEANISLPVDNRRNYLFQTLEKASHILFGATVIIAQAVHKIFNYVLPNFLNPAHLISFAGSCGCILLELPKELVDNFNSFKKDFLYTGTLNPLPFKEGVREPVASA